MGTHWGRLGGEAAKVVQRADTYQVTLKSSLEAGTEQPRPFPSLPL